MFRRLSITALIASLLTFTAGPVLADDSSDYPDVATIDGTAGSIAPDAAEAFKVDPPLQVESYDPGTSADVPAADPPDSPPNSHKRTMWGYASAPTNAALFEYQIGADGGPPLTVKHKCQPAHKAGYPASQNGRGLAWDPLTNTLWNSEVNAAFIGDGFIHRNSLPETQCAPIEDLPFADGPGGTVQDDIGAIDVDEATKNLWVTGYKPVFVVGAGLLSYLYKVNRNTGQVIDSCAIRFRGGGVGNDTLAVFRDTTLPGSSKYLLTDAGELITTPNSFALIDQSDCHGGQVVRPVMEFPKTTPGGVSGIDMEWPGLLNANSLTRNIHNNGNQPFTAPLLLGSGTDSIKDISLCGFRAKFGGDGNDFCPLP
jgi:hypothetical protein